MRQVNVNAVLDGIDFSPESTEKEIIQNVKTILTTVMGSCPLFRDFGIDISILDIPTSVVKARITMEVKQKIEKYEPRCKFTGISWEGSDGMEGKIYPTVSISLL